MQTTCPSCGGPARRETDTLDCHFDALWLWVPVCVPPQDRERSLEEILALEDLRTWLPSERVVAGSDSGNFVFDQRIITKALRDIGPLAFLADGEPFAGCLFHEMVIRDGRKMSKHLGNVVDPDELVARYGADTVRLATLYAARPQRSLNWSDSAVLRCHRFLTRCGTSRRAISPRPRSARPSRRQPFPRAPHPTASGQPPSHPRAIGELTARRAVRSRRRSRPATPPSTCARGWRNGAILPSRRSPRRWRISRCTARCAT